MKRVKLFLSSTFDQPMVSQRDLFRNELRYRLEEELGQYGIYFYLFDFELGIPKDTKPLNVIRMCLRAAAESSMFIGIVGNQYGTLIKNFLKEAEEREKLKKEYPMLAEAVEENVSVLELEFQYAMKSGRRNLLFLVVKDNQGKRSRKVQKLIAGIRQSGRQWREVLSYADMKNAAAGWILNIVHGACKGIEPSARTAYAIRKTRYYVEDNQISDIYKYIEGSSRKTLCIYSGQGSGKTVMAARMYLEKQRKGMCFAFVGCDAYTLGEVIFVLLKQLFEYYGMPVEKLNDACSERELVQLFQETMKKAALYPSKCCLMIDGADKIRMMDVFSVNMILPDKLPENVKIVITTSDKALISHKKAVFMRHMAVDKNRMLKKMLWSEGKQGEEKNMLFLKRAEMSSYRIDYEIKAAVYFSLQRYCCYHGEYKKALRYLDAAEALIEARLGREEYGEVCETIFEAS